MIPPTTVTVELDPDVYVRAAETIDAHYYSCACVAIFRVHQEFVDPSNWLFLDSPHVVFFSDILKPEWAKTGDIWYCNEADRIVALLLVSQLAREHNATIRRRARHLAK